MFYRRQQTWGGNLPWILTMVGLLGFLNGGKAQAVSIVVASHLPPGSGSTFDTGAGKTTQGEAAKSQTFTALADGFLDEIAFLVHKGTPTNVDLRVTLATEVNDLPSTSIASAFVSQVGLPTVAPPSNTTSFNAVASFASQQILLDAGTRYAIVFSSDTLDANYRLHGRSNGYSGGQLASSFNGGPFTASSSSDLFFQVTVTPVPEPGTWIIATLGCLGVACYGMRQRASFKGSVPGGRRR
ncbi:MAG: hypothetical protein AB7O59_08805 [Pirellulales bacterium]